MADRVRTQKPAAHDATRSVERSAVPQSAWQRINETIPDDDELDLLPMPDTDTEDNAESAREPAPAATATADAPAPARADAPAAATHTQPQQQTHADAPQARRALLVDDVTSAVDRGQMPKAEFLAALRTSVRSTADNALAGTPWSSDGCPWIEYWFTHYEGKDAAHVERALQRYAPEASGVSEAAGYIPVVSERVRKAVRNWARTGELNEVPEGVPASIQEAKSKEAAGIHFKAREGGARGADPETVRQRLGSGVPLDSSTRGRMEEAYGADFSHVRVHTGPTASSLSSQLNARAFAVGNEVAFGAGEYKPGTVTGDALLAHELAHVVQQQGATESSGAATAEPALERDADRSAASAVASLWGRTKGALGRIGESAGPRLRSGLSISRCGGDATSSGVRFPSYTEIVGDSAVQTRMSTAWTSTKNATTPTSRREEGFWIRLNTGTAAYEFTGDFTGTPVGPADGAAATPTPKPADTADPAGGTYTVAMFHTHTPTTHRTVGRAVGPSTADETFHSNRDVVGVVYDYTESPAGSGNIPAGHPLESAAQTYHCGPNRRQNV